MIQIYVNQAERTDIEIEEGGTLSQTEEHVTSSNISVKIPIETDNLATYDYVEIYSDTNLIFAGTVLNLEQRALNTGYTDVAYNLTLASNADLVANVLVDMNFPSGATITQILMGNKNGDPWYNADIREFRGVVQARIIPEDVTIGIVERYDLTVLEKPSYLWGVYCKEILDNLATLTESYWEITNDKIFNFRRKNSDTDAPITLNTKSKVFDLKPSEDALATYSAVRVVGGEGETKPRSTAYPSAMWSLNKEQTILTCSKKLAAVTAITVFVDRGAYVFEPVGYKGIHNDDNRYYALMSHGGNTIELKSKYAAKGYKLYNYDGDDSIGTVAGVSFLTTITARTEDFKAINEIKQKRGGTGIIEHVIEDKSITSFEDAALNANAFLDLYRKSIKCVSFSTFVDGWEVGQKLQADIPYYKLNGNYFVSSVNIKFINDLNGRLCAQKEITATTSLYRDHYRMLFYTPHTLSFNIGDNSGNIHGISITNTITIQQTVVITRSNATRWGELENRTWNFFKEKTFKDIYRFEIEVMHEVANYLTDKYKELYTQVMDGTFVNNKAPYNNPSCLSLVGGLVLEPNTPYKRYECESISPTVGNKFTLTYFILENEAQQKITELGIEKSAVEERRVRIPVDIDKSPENPNGEYALTISITNEIK